MRALEKDRNRRYESASALAADVRRYLDDEPVQAAPPSRWYQTAKYIRRHKLAATVTALSCSLLAFGIGATAWQAFRATKAEQSAEERYEIAKEAVDTYLLEVTQDEQLASPAFQDLRRRLLESAEKFYDRLSRERPTDLRQKSHKGAALHNLGKVHVETGKYGIAHQAFERATTIYEELLQEEPQSTAHVLDLTYVLESRGNLWCRQGDNGNAAPYFQRSLALRTSLYSAAPSDPELAHARAEAQLRVGSVQWDDQGRRNLAEAAELLTLVSTQHPESTVYQESLAQSHQNWADHLEAVSEPAACQHHEAAVAIYARLAAANADSVKFQIALAVAQALQGDTFYRFNRLEESRKCRLQAVEGLTRLAAKYPGRVDVEVQLGRIMHLLGQNEEDFWLNQMPGSNGTAACGD